MKAKFQRPEGPQVKAVGNKVVLKKRTKTDFIVDTLRGTMVSDKPVIKGKNQKGVAWG